ncbi:hypothetical protein HK104_007987, partial [Borealophlyctis nickersoniae]
MSQADGRFALKTDLESIGYSFYTKEQADARFMPVTYTPPTVDLSGYVLQTTADTLYKDINWEPDPNVWAAKSDLLDFLPFNYSQQLFYPRPEADSIFATKAFVQASYVQPSALGNYYTKAESDTYYVQRSTLSSYYTKGDSDARFLPVGSPIVYPANAPLDSSDGKRRIYFANNDRTYNYSPNGYEWRNATDTSSLLTLDNNGTLSTGTLTTGNVALQYNTLFLALNGDANHFISHGMSTVASANYNLDGVVVQGGVGGGALGQS